jgi:hypothetical protein
VQELRSAAREADGLSFAQLRESYILAGQLAFDDGILVGTEHLWTGLELMGRGGLGGVNCGLGFVNPSAATRH